MSSVISGTPKVPWDLKKHLKHQREDENSSKSYFSVHNEWWNNLDNWIK
jgi:hypothetical protein